MAKQPANAPRTAAGRAPTFAVAVCLGVLLGAGATLAVMQRPPGASHPKPSPDLAGDTRWLAAVEHVLDRGNGAVSQAYGRRGPRPGEGEALRTSTQAVLAFPSAAELAAPLEAFTRDCQSLLDYAAEASSLLLQLDTHHETALAGLDAMEQALGDARGVAPQAPCQTLLVLSRCRSSLHQLKVEYRSYGRIQTTEQLAQVANPDYFTGARDALQEIVDTDPRVAELAAQQIEQSFAAEDRVARLHSLFVQQVHPLQDGLPGREAAVRAAVAGLAATARLGGVR